MKTQKLAVLLSAIVLFAACGDSAVTGDPTTTQPPATTTAEIPSTTTTTVPATTTIPTTTTSMEMQIIDVYFSVEGDDCSAVEGFERSGPIDVDPVQFALEQVLAGPTPSEEAAGAGSFFSSQTTDALVALDLTDGLLTVEFRDIRFLNNASTSCGSAALLGSLTETVFQFSEVERVRYTIWGSCSLFWNWLQTECGEVTREGWTAAPIDTAALASGSGCTPGPGALPDGRWFGSVTDPTIQNIQFDLACWFSGVGAIEATIEDSEESPPPNDYYIRNTSTDVRTVPVSSSVEVRWLPPDDIANPTDIDYSEWIAIRDERGWLPGLWLTVLDGEVVDIEEQYQP